VRLNLIYTLGVVALSMSALPWGMLADWKGPRVVLLLSACVFGAGCLLFSYSSRTGTPHLLSRSLSSTHSLNQTGFDGYIPGWMAMATGGAGHFFSLMLFAYIFRPPPNSLSDLGLPPICIEISSMLVSQCWVFIILLSMQVVFCFLHTRCVELYLSFGGGMRIAYTACKF